MNKTFLKNLPKVALIGRTNVGKSTIFNRLTEEKGAIVTNLAGTTRDRKFGEVWWLGHNFLLIDTAGLDVSTEKLIDLEAIEQTKIAIKQADLILLVVDAKDGLLIQDREYAKMLRKTKKPIILVINKVDSQKEILEAAIFEKLGIKNSCLVSAATGAGTGDLLDLILEKLKDKLPKTEHKSNLPVIKLGLIGKPNVGKSSLINKLAGEERVIVSSIPHTTRDSQEIYLEVENENQKYQLTFIDTAGMCKKGKLSGFIEEKSVEQSLETIEKSDIVLLIIDASSGVSAQDNHIASKILEAGKSLILVVNKWDLVENKTIKSAKVFTDYLRREMPFLSWAPIVFVSAKTGAKINRLMKKIFEIYKNQQLKISNSQLDKFLKYIIKRQPPQKAIGVVTPYIHHLRQIKTNPQTFEMLTDQPKNIHFSYMRYIINSLREHFNLAGVGVKVITKFPPRKIKKHPSKSNKV